MTGTAVFALSLHLYGILRKVFLSKADFAAASLTVRVITAATASSSSWILPQTTYLELNNIPV